MEPELPSSPIKPATDTQRDSIDLPLGVSIDGLPADSNTETQQFYWRFVAIIMLVCAPLVLAAILSICQRVEPAESSRPALSIGLSVWGVWVVAGVIMLIRRIAFKHFIVAVLAVSALSAIPYIFK